MHRSISIPELPRVINQCVAPAGFLVSVTASSLSHIMKSTKGKERLIAFAQYSAELYRVTMTQYIDKNKVKMYPLSLKNSRNLETSMKNGRKLMRVLMFLDELSALEKVLKVWNKLDKVMILQALSYISGTIFYLLDNLVWCSDIGIINNTIYALNVKWKNTKDVAAYSKSLLQVVISVIFAKRRLDQQKELKKQIIDKFAVVETGSEHYNCLEALLSARRQFRFRVIDVIINVFRFFMLWKSLGLPWAHTLSKEFVAICGILTSSLGLFSMLVGEEVIKIEDKPVSPSNN